VQKAVTLSDIGKEVGLSVATVSQVLNGKSGRYSKVTRGRVIEVARNLNYKPNMAARSLKTQKTLTIGLVVPVLSMELDEVEEICASKGYTLSLAVSHNDPGRQHDKILELRQKHVDGIVLVHPRKDCKAVEQLRAEGYPLVISDVAVNYPEVDTFLIDLKGSIRVAVQHLVDLGHHRIASILSQSDSHYSQLRYKYWKEETVNRGFDSYEDWCFPLERMPYPVAKSIYHSSYQSARMFLERFEKDDPLRPTAIMAITDRVAMGAIKAFEEAGWRIPEDISIISAEATEMGRFCSTPLTSIEINHVKCRSEALIHLISLTSGEDKGSRPARRTFGLELVYGQSTSRPCFL
jgi:DNA-binding LacI/PurR family transcriptional regulator